MKRWIQILNLAVCLILLVAVIAQGRRLEALQESVDDQLDMLHSQLSGEISSVSYRVEEALEQQARLVEDFSLEPVGIDEEEKALSAQASVTLKAWSPDTAVTLTVNIAGTTQSVSMTSDGQGGYTAQVLLPLEAGRELTLNAQILSQGVTRREDLGAWGDISLLLPLRNSGGGWTGPEYRDGALHSKFSIDIEGRDGNLVSVQEPRFLIYRNGELVQTLDAVKDPYSDTAQDCSFTVDSDDNLWSLECAEGDVIHIRFRCRDEFGLGYDFLFQTWVVGQDDVQYESSAAVQSGSFALELFWE